MKNRYESKYNRIFRCKWLYGLLHNFHKVKELITVRNMLQLQQAGTLKKCDRDETMKTSKKKGLNYPELKHDQDENEHGDDKSEDGQYS